MLGRIIRLAIVVLLLLAAFRVGQAYKTHYVFADEVDQLARSGARTEEGQVRDAIMEAAARLRVPLEPERLHVRVQPDHVYVDLDYTRAIEVLPGYRRPWVFDVSAHGWIVPSGGIRKR